MNPTATYIAFDAAIIQAAKLSRSRTLTSCQRDRYKELVASLQADKKATELRLVREAQRVIDKAAEHEEAAQTLDKLKGNQEMVFSSFVNERHWLYPDEITMNCGLGERAVFNNLTALAELGLVQSEGSDDGWRHGRYFTTQLGSTAAKLLGTRLEREFAASVALRA